MCDDTMPEMTETEREALDNARATHHIISVEFPTMVKMRPVPRLQLGKPCPHGKDGECDTCDNFLGTYHPDGTTFAFAVYEGFCKK